MVYTYNGIVFSLKDKLVFIYDTEWEDPEVRMQSEIIQIPKCKCHVVPFV